MTGASVNRQWLLQSRPVGEISPSDFDFKESPVSEIDDGMILTRTLYISLDPAQRSWMRATRGYRDPIEIGDVVASLGVGQVLESKHPDYAVGDRVVGMVGWQDYAVFDSQTARGLSKVPDGLPVPTYAFLGPMGINGLTAYFGLLDIGQPKEGETLVVSAAAGATGSLVGQIGKIKGCRVVGIAGSDEKCAWLTDELGFDAAINYKTENVYKSLKQHCPDGIDIYFDNVGGEILDMALAQVNNFARIIACGMISIYNSTEPVPGPTNMANIVTRRVRMEGFIVTDYSKRYMEGLAQLGQWMMSGQLKARFDIVEGLENTPEVYNRLFDGSNNGKLIVQVSGEDNQSA